MRQGKRASLSLGALAAVLVAGCGDGALGPTASSDAVQAPFRIDVRILGPATAEESQAVTAAVQAWNSVIKSRLPAAHLKSAANACFPGQPGVNESVPGLLLFVQFAPLDGVGKALAQSGPCYLRSGSSLPIMGSLTLDVSDLPPLDASGRLQTVVTHEIAHILGFGTIWSNLHLLTGASSDPEFVGSSARVSYHELGSSADGVPVENTGGTGTRDAHWRESVFGDELMTPYINDGANPLSAVTIAAMRDLGYDVELSRAEPYSLPSSAVSADEAPLDIEPREILLTPRFVVQVPAP